MNLHQVERKRLRELLGAIREARHVVHAERPAVARAIRLAHAAQLVVKRAVEKAARVSSTLPADDLAISVDVSDVIQWQAAQADQLREAEQEVTRRLARLDKARDIKAGAVTNPRAARAKRKAAQTKREQREAAKRAEAGKQLRTILLHLRQRLHEIPDEKIRLTALRGIEAAEKPDTFILGAYITSRGFPDWMVDGLKQARKILLAGY